MPDGSHRGPEIVEQGVDDSRGLTGCSSPAVPRQLCGWITDLGGIWSARATEAAILFVPHVIRSSGFTPFAVSIAR